MRTATKTEASKAREESQKANQAKYEQIAALWSNFATGIGKIAYDDLMQYIESQREMFRKYAEERVMPHPNPQEGKVPIDNEMVAALLQNSRGLSIVKTYLESRVDTPGGTNQ